MVELVNKFGDPANANGICLYLVYGKEVGDSGGAASDAAQKLTEEVLHPM